MTACAGPGCGDAHPNRPGPPAAPHPAASLAAFLDSASLSRSIATSLPRRQTGNPAGSPPWPCSPCSPPWPPTPPPPRPPSPSSATPAKQTGESEP